MQSLQPRSCQETQNIKIKIKGLGVLKGNPKSIRVLYGKVDTLDDDRIWDIIQQTQKRFYNAGLLKIIQEPQLHATLINTKYLGKQGRPRGDAAHTC